MSNFSWINSILIFLFYFYLFFLMINYFYIFCAQPVSLVKKFKEYSFLI